MILDHISVSVCSLKCFLLCCVCVSQLSVARLKPQTLQSQWVPSLNMAVCLMLLQPLKDGICRPVTQREGVCNTVGALLTNRVVRWSCSQSRLSTHATAQPLQRAVELPVGSPLSSSLYGVFFCGGVCREDRPSFLIPEIPTFLSFSFYRALTHRVKILKGFSCSRIFPKYLIPASGIS